MTDTSGLLTEAIVIVASYPSSNSYPSLSFTIWFSSISIHSLSLVYVRSGTVALSGLALAIISNVSSCSRSIISPVWSKSISVTAIITVTLQVAFNPPNSVVAVIVAKKVVIVAKKVVIVAV